MARQVRRLTRSSYNRMIAGVCGGLGEYFGLDPTVVRVGYIVFSVLSAAFPGIFVYLLAWLIVPRDDF
ncbi:MAG: PspC domain-containing protein [Bacillota bacterium]